VGLTEDTRGGLAAAPEFIEIVRVCKFQAHKCQLCGLAKSHKSHNKKTGTCPYKRKTGCVNCGKAKAHVDHMGEAPSLNVLGSGDPRTFISLKEQWEKALIAALDETELPKPCWSIMVEGEITFPAASGGHAGARGGARDQGNFRFMLEKALGDALQQGGWLEDDNWDAYQFGNLSYRIEPGVSRTRLMLMPVVVP